MRLGPLAAAAVLLAVAPAHAAVRTGASNWEWGDPRPQGNSLEAVSFAGLRGYAVGEGGTLLASPDGGRSWTGLATGTTARLAHVQAIDGDSVVAAGDCVARRSDDGGRTVRPLAITSEPGCASPIAALAFADERFGLAVLADRTVLQTADAGNEFTRKTPLPPGGRPTHLTLLSASLGFATTSDGRILRTTDGGNSWQAVAAAGRELLAVTFADARTGYAVGAGSLLLKSEDGGATWSPRPLTAPGDGRLRTISCATTQLCVAGLEGGEALVRTADGGSSFTFPSVAGELVRAADFGLGLRLSAVGRDGAMALSEDGGQTIGSVGVRLGEAFTALRAGRQAGTAYALGAGGRLAQSVDGGRSWSRADVPTGADLVDVSFPSAVTGYAIDRAGGLFATGSGGREWAPLGTGTTIDPAAVLSPERATVLLVGPRGLRRSDDAGRSFSDVQDPAVLGVPLERADVAGEALVVSGRRAIARSEDGGQTWDPVPAPPSRLAGVDFVSPAAGFALGTDGRVWRTTDAGRRWAELPAIGNRTGRLVAFSTARRGYVAVDRFGDRFAAGGTLLRTDDAGRTWRPQVVSPAAVRGLAAAPGSGPDFLLAGPSALLFTTTGGDTGGGSQVTLRPVGGRPAGPGRVRIAVRLRPARGGERVTVSRRRAGSGTWSSRTVPVSSAGTASLTLRLGRGLYEFVAQWAGSTTARGDGSTVRLVRVGG